MKKNKVDEKNQFDPYKPDKLSRVPLWIKVFVMKAWSAAMVFYMFNMGLGVVIPAHLDRWVITALVMGLVLHFFINKVFVFMENDKQPMAKYMMIGVHKISVALNTIYAVLLTTFILVLGNVLFINFGISISKLFYPEQPASWEPFMFGLLYFVLDWSALKLKHGIIYLINKKNNKDIA